MASIALVVVTHDSTQWLPELARTWQAAVGHARVDVEAVVADSGSKDQTVGMVQKVWPAAQVVRCGDVGFGAAANAGVRTTSAPWVVVGNPDVRFAADFLGEIMGAMGRAHAKTACLAPRLLNGDGTVQASVGRFPTLRSIVCDQFRPRERRKYVFPQPREAQVIDWASGACLAFRRAAFESIGGFDERYFLYGEEVDLQRRLRDAGWAVRFVLAARVEHLQPHAGRPPSAQTARWAARGTLRYFATFGGWGELRGYGLLTLGSGRLPLREALASRERILTRNTKTGEASSSTMLS
jgi:N-acetylglucosaminyl-diphospho-decaprenol L-rhamnosyltransferase